MTNEKTVLACPECDTSREYRSSPRGCLRDWKCYGCGAEFDEPKERPPKRGGGISAEALLARFKDD